MNIQKTFAVWTNTRAASRFCGPQQIFFYYEIHVASGGGTHRIQTSCVLNNSENFVENLYFEAEVVQIKSSNVIFSPFLCFVDMAADFYKSCTILIARRYYPQFPELTSRHWWVTVCPLVCDQSDVKPVIFHLKD